MNRILTALSFAWLASMCMAVTCRPDPPPVDPTAAGGSAPVVDAGNDGSLPPEDGGTSCQRACSRMALLKCPGWQGSPAGASCEEVCENHESSNVASFCPDDVAKIQGTFLPDGGRGCDEQELQAAFEACL